MEAIRAIDQVPACAGRLQAWKTLRPQLQSHESWKGSRGSDCSPATLESVTVIGSKSRGAFTGQLVLIISSSAGYNRWRLGNAPPPSAAEAWADGQVEIVTMKWRHGCFYHQPSRLQLP
ncbi:uncharacterized [Tachysurus ichikawai]